MTGFVYAIQSGPRVKLGWSANPLRRLAKIASDSPFPSRLLGVAPGAKEDEARLHADFAALRLHGEWFEADTPILDRIATWPQSTPEARKRKVYTRASASPIGAYRETNELTMEEFGALLGVQKAVVLKWEKGHRPSPKNAIRIEEATQGAIPRWRLRPDLWSEEEPL